MTAAEIIKLLREHPVCCGRLGLSLMGTSDGRTCVWVDRSPILFASSNDIALLKNPIRWLTGACVEWCIEHGVEIDRFMVERDRDLERITAERDALRRECESLRGKLECLPQTEDGHPIVPGMTLYIACPSDWHRPDLVKHGRPILTYFTAKDYEVHPHYSRYKMFADSEAAKVDAEKDRAAASAAKETT